MKKADVLGTIVVDEIIFGVVGVRLGEGMFLLDAVTERGTVDFGGGLVDCTVFDSDGREVLSLTLPLPRLRTHDGHAYVTLPVYISEAVSNG